MAAPELGPDERRRLQAAAERGDVDAQYRLGRALLRQTRREEAKRWLEPLAEAGHAWAAQQLAWDASFRARTDAAYEAEAEHWFRRLAQIDESPDAALVRMAHDMAYVWASGRVTEAEELLVLQQDFAV